MNFIVLMLDSMRQDHLSVYNQGAGPFEGVPACRTPNLDRFAESAVVFDNAYPEGLPTIPVRTALMIGQQTLPFRPWQPLAPEDVSVATILRREGFVNGLISDCYHYRAPGMNFHRDFSCYRWVRGQEYDPWVSSPPKRDVTDYVNDSYPDHWRARIGQFLANTDDFTRPEDWFPTKVCADAVQWLEANRGHGDLFLWVDSFEPHEPWDPPSGFDTYTDPAYAGKRLIMPMGGPADTWATKDEQRHIQGLYAGEAAFVDHCFGPLFEALERLGYYEDSVIVVTADHGHPLADHGKFLKGPDRMYSELLKVPFIIRLPGGRHGGRRVSALVQFHDLLPTMLDVMGLPGNDDAMHGRSFRAVLEGETDGFRDAVCVGFFQGVDRCIRDRQWSYVARPAGEPDELYDLLADPRERNNVIDEHSAEAVRLASRFGSYFRKVRGTGVVKGVQGTYEMASGSVD
jgi:arylsulfatase A-like enzyme